MTPTLVTSLCCRMCIYSEALFYCFSCWWDWVRRLLIRSPVRLLHASWLPMVLTWIWRTRRVSRLLTCAPTQICAKHWRNATKKDTGYFKAVSLNIQVFDLASYIKVLDSDLFLQWMAYYTSTMYSADSLKAHWRQYYFVQPTGHDLALSWLFRPLEQCDKDLLTYIVHVQE